MIDAAATMNSFLPERADIGRSGRLEERGQERSSL